MNSPEKEKREQEAYESFFAESDQQKSPLRPQPKVEWSEDDERMLSRCIKSVECSKQFTDSETYKAAKDMEMNWLKSLPERFNLKPKQEWSKEDEMYLSQAIDTLEFENYFILAEKLKSLRPQPRWKPSEEQMDALAYAIQLLDDGLSPKAAKAGEELEHLREQLKKL